MATVSFTIPNAIAQELNQIAQKGGFTNAKEMIIAYLKAEIKAGRVNNLGLSNLRETAEKQADVETSSIS